jgi:hypothetical protein
MANRPDREDATHGIVLASEIPPEHPARREIEEALCSALAGLPGQWRISVVCSRTSVWWVLRVDGPGFQWTTVLADAAKQNPPDITASLLGALRTSKVLS